VLKALIQQVDQFEQRRAKLQERVSLIEQLRRGQSGPVHLLDQISRSLPDMLWLTDIKQQGDSLTISGRCTAQTALSDFITNLNASGYFKADLGDSQVEPAQPGQAELIRVSVKAQFVPPGS
jgi:type IV pilus assembly protein PilN